MLGIFYNKRRGEERGREERRREERRGKEKTYNRDLMWATA